jgi:hypothetical protein
VEHDRLNKVAKTEVYEERDKKDDDKKKEKRKKMKFTT